MTPILPPPRSSDYKRKPGGIVPSTPAPAPLEFRLGDEISPPPRKILQRPRRFPLPAEIKMSAPSLPPPVPQRPQPDSQPVVSLDVSSDSSSDIPSAEEEAGVDVLVPDPAGDEDDERIGVPVRKVNREVVATVGSAKIVAEDVFELWNEKWRKIQADVRNGRMSAAAGDRLLQEEWRNAVNSLVRDEVLHQVALRDYDARFTSIVDELASDSDKPRQQVAAETLRRLKEEQDKALNQIRAREISKNGGAVRIQMHLEALGVSPQEWLSRMEKKAYTQNFLVQTLKLAEAEPSPHALRDYYNDHPDEFVEPGPVRFRHIFFSTFLRGGDAKADAVEVWEHLSDRSISFEEAVGDFSDDRVSAERGGLESGGDSGVPERDAWLRDLREFAREERPGRLAPILESPFGFHILETLSVAPPKRRAFLAVQKDIEQKLADDRWEREVEKHYLTVKGSVPVRLTMKRFPDELSCLSLNRMSARAPRIITLARPEVEIGKISRKM